ncbi:hypothetical protein COT42_00715 [Candidatus Saganbacteria bacterium CG08_land_8_20_14_0_20_45_16]|uniref:Uncharacterized protein n=1 Tax=Candidatus Saganbacteria bacterium CG08_land_8_20_14_0_20_45_16 TaxID=2014293 RepID=A0A2H0Y1M3_UNCSA|nr:MAG: hypothetical protein COT42_00715 [Candidatus Saganbacteria bacterium CG08_land_8_20_14_0_20_45_16]
MVDERVAYYCCFVNDLFYGSHDLVFGSINMAAWRDWSDDDCGTDEECDEGWRGMCLKFSNKTPARLHKQSL